MSHSHRESDVFAMHPVASAYGKQQADFLPTVAHIPRFGENHLMIQDRIKTITLSPKCIFFPFFLKAIGRKWIKVSVRSHSPPVKLEWWITKGNDMLILFSYLPQSAQRYCQWSWPLSSWHSVKVLPRKGTAQHCRAELLCVPCKMQTDIALDSSAPQKACTAGQLPATGKDYYCCTAALSDACGII